MNDDAPTHGMHGRIMTQRQLSKIMTKLERIYPHEQAEMWMHSNHPMLGERQPVDCSYHEVMRVIDVLKSGA
jgi:uncharacterized protein (DUF2384 family)